MNDRTEQPDTDTLRVDFIPSAWWRNTRGRGTILILVALLFGRRWMRADEVARSYSDFWGLDPVQLPYGYWFGLDTWLVLAGLARLLVLRLRRDPHLQIGERDIETTFTQSFTRRIDRNRVTEVRFDPARGTIRFEVPGGLVLTVDAGLLDFSSIANDATRSPSCVRESSTSHSSGSELGIEVCPPGAAATGGRVPWGEERVPRVGGTRVG